MLQATRAPWPVSYTHLDVYKRQFQLRLIEPAKADGSVRGVLMTLAAKDQSQYIKSQARTMLAQLPEID